VEDAHYLPCTVCRYKLGAFVFQQQRSAHRVKPGAHGDIELVDLPTPLLLSGANLQLEECHGLFSRGKAPQAE
jgi:hypothetical protein